MRWVRKDAIANPLFAGTWLSLGSSVAAEMAALAGFDWILIDMEHGFGGTTELLHQLQAIGERSAAIVRVPGIDEVSFKQVFDLGPSGIMVPGVNSAEEARTIVDFARIAPLGRRGVAQSTRASGYSADFASYVAEVNEGQLIMAQIETRRAIDAVDEIAAVEGIDVLFVGPLDLCLDLGLEPGDESPAFDAHLKKVVAAARRHGKAAGILLRRPEQIDRYLRLGFSVLSLGSDRGLIGNGMRQLHEDFVAARRTVDAKAVARG